MITTIQHIRCDRCNKEEEVMGEKSYALTVIKEKGWYVLYTTSRDHPTYPLYAIYCPKCKPIIKRKSKPEVKENEK